MQLLCSIQYRIVRKNADVFYELQNPKEQIQAYVFDVFRALVPRMTLDELFEQKGEVAKAVLEELEARALVPRMTLDELFEQKGEVAKAVLEELEEVRGAYGYNIEHILMVDIIPDAAVCKAMNEINASN